MAVYEHRLPAERRTLMPQLSDHLWAGGILFINQTPHRWFPYEHQSTALWGTNYLPRPLALASARRFSRMNPGHQPLARRACAPARWHPAVPASTGSSSDRGARCAHPAAAHPSQSRRLLAGEHGRRAPPVSNA
jgi:hypothetical protein